MFFCSADYGEISVVKRGCFQESVVTNDGCNQTDDTGIENLLPIFRQEDNFSSPEGDVCRCSTDLCNTQQKATTETLCWLAGLLFAFIASHL